RSGRRREKAAAFTRHDPVARVFAQWHGRDREPFGELRGQVLRAVDPQVDPAVPQRLVDLAREEVLAGRDAVHAGEPVAGRRERDDLDFESAGERSPDDFELGERELAAPSPEANLQSGSRSKRYRTASNLSSLRAASLSFLSRRIGSWSSFATIESASGRTRSRSAAGRRSSSPVCGGTAWAPMRLARCSACSGVRFAILRFRTPASRT